MGNIFSKRKREAPEVKIVGVSIRPPRTSIKWSDGTITTVICSDQDNFDVENGILWAIAKKFVSLANVSSAVAEGKRILENG